jgi:hypothetical protein
MEGCPWSDWAQRPALFCEASLCAWVRQPGNSWSNVGFLVAGALIWRATAEPRHRHLRPMAWILALMGVGSLFFHASETLLGLWLDYAGMYAMTAYMGAFVLARSLGTRRDVVFAVLFLAGMGSLLVPGAPVRGIFVVANLICPIFEAKMALRPETRASSYRWFAAAYAAFLPAVGLWVLDEQRLLCDPDNHVLSGHAAWHLLDAAMFWFSFLYYRELKALDGSMSGSGSGGQPASTTPRHIRRPTMR